MALRAGQKTNNFLYLVKVPFLLVSSLCDRDSLWYLNTATPHECAWRSFATTTTTRRSRNTRAANHYRVASEGENLCWCQKGNFRESQKPARRGGRIGKREGKCRSSGAARRTSTSISASGGRGGPIILSCTAQSPSRGAFLARHHAESLQRTQLPFAASARQKKHQHPP